MKVLLIVDIVQLHLAESLIHNRIHYFINAKFRSGTCLLPVPHVYHKNKGKLQNPPHPDPTFSNTFYIHRMYIGEQYLHKCIICKNHDNAICKPRTVYETRAFYNYFINKIIIP